MKETSGKKVYVAIGWCCWSKSDTIEGAIAGLKKEGGRKRSRTCIVREYPAESNPRVDSVDGSVWYDNGFGESREVLRMKNGKKVEA